MLKKTLTLISFVLLLALVVPSFAAGPVYDELPDLEGAEVVIAMENFYTPYQFNDPRSEDPIGFEYDLVNEICNRVNCTPVYEQTSFELQLAGVQNGDYDAALNGLFITEERQENFDFSAPYLESGTFLLGRADEDRFDSIESFIEVAADEDLLFGVQANSFGQVIATDFYSVPEDNIVTFEEFGLLLQALSNGDIDVMVADAFAGEFVGVGAENFKLVGEQLVDSLPIGIIFTQGSPYAEAFTAAIDSMRADGYIDYLYYKWSIDFQVAE